MPKNCLSEEGRVGAQYGANGEQTEILSAGIGDGGGGEEESL